MLLINGHFQLASLPRDAAGKLQGSNGATSHRLYTGKHPNSQREIEGRLVTGLSGNICK
jgi:hypothetical protein